MESYLVDPQAFNGLFVLCCFWSRQANALNDAGEIAKVEQVVRLSRGRQEILHGVLVQGHCAVHNLCGQIQKIIWKLKTLGKKNCQKKVSKHNNPLLALR